MMGECIVAGIIGGLIAGLAMGYVRVVFKL